MVLCNPGKVQTEWHKLASSSGIFRDPEKCSHNHYRRIAPGKWECLGCGEPVKDSEEKIQTTFDLEAFTVDPFAGLNTEATSKYENVYL